MTELTEAQLAAAMRVAKAASEHTLQTDLDRSLRSIFSAAEIELIDKWVTTNAPTMIAPKPSAGWSSWG